MPTLSVNPSQHSSDRGGASILAAVIHATAGTNSLSHLIRNADGVSAHALIDKSGLIRRMVPNSRAAHHVGFSQIRMRQRIYGRSTRPNANQITLGVELENKNNGRDPYPDAQIASLGWLLVDWAWDVPDLALLKHEDIDTQGKSDPANLSWQRIYAAMAPWQASPAGGLYQVVTETPVWEAPDAYAPIALGGAARLTAGSVEQCGPLTSGPTTWLHVSSGIGFIPRIAATMAAANPQPIPSPRAYSELSPLIAPPGLSRDHLAAAMVKRCAQSPYGGDRIAEFARNLYDYAVDAGADPVPVGAQVCHETANLTSPKSQPPQHNTAGIGATNDGAAGVFFPSLEASAHAQIGRLIAYAVPPIQRTAAQAEAVAIGMLARPLPLKCHGSAPYLYLLGSEPNTVDGCGWAHPGPDYGRRVADVANALVRLAQ